MMKKNYSFYSLLLLLPIGIMTLVGFSGGQPGSFSGSPGDSGATCLQCHAAGTTYTGNVMLNGVPSSYSANTPYTLTLNVSGSNATRFGFNITAEDANGNKVGTWSAGTGSRLRTGGSGQGLTHSSASNSSWTFQWTAPASDVGGITFHYATIQGVGSGTSNDQMVSGSSSAVLSNPDVKIDQFELYPSTVDRELTVNLHVASAGVASIYDMNGSLISTTALVQENQLDVSSLANGVYIMSVSVNGQQQSQRFIKQ